MNQFMFMPGISPFVNNAATVNKNIHKKHVFVILICTAFLLTALIFGILMSFRMSEGDGSFRESRSAEDSKSAAYFSFGLSLLTMVIAFIIAAVGALNFVVNSKDKNNPAFSLVPAKLAQIFMWIIIFRSASDLLGSMGAFALEILAEETNEVIPENDLFYQVFLMKAVPAVFLLIWAITGLVFFSSFKKTVRGVCIADKGTASFKGLSCILAVIFLVMLLLYDLNGFKGGLFYSAAAPELIPETVEKSLTSVVVINAAFAACSVALFSLMLFSNDYSKAVKEAVGMFYQGAAATPAPPQPYTSPAEQDNISYEQPTDSAPFQQNNSLPPLPYTRPAAQNSISSPYSQPFGSAPFQQNMPMPPQPYTRPAEQDTFSYEQTADNAFFQEDMPVTQKDTATICKACGASNPSDCTYCIECGKILQNENT